MEGERFKGKWRLEGGFPVPAVRSSLPNVLEKEMAPHSSVLAWRIPWASRSLVGCSPWGLTESDTTEAT